jgi:hypothetical protein
LYDTVVLLRRRDDLPPFPDVVRERLLDINVFARLTRPDGSQRVPVVGRGHDHRVHVLVVEQAADIGAGCDRAARLLHDLDAVVQNRLVRIAQRSDLCPADF